MSDNTILIQIASYRDPDLINTIRNILDNTKYPELITFGICHQYGNDVWDNPDNFRIDSRFKVNSIPYNESKGACWARSLTQKFLDNETFTLQIDSHTRCEPNWDEKLLELYYNFNNPKIVLSTYPSMFTPGQDYSEYKKTIYSCHVYGMKKGFISARPRGLVDKSKPMKAIAVAAGFVFGPASIIQDVGYDPEFYFTGEEAAMALRLFTNGYDLYHPNINLFYHYYTRKDQVKHWNDHNNHYAYTLRSNSRLGTLLGYNNINDLGNYGLGSIRSIEDWRKYSGIDYVNKKLHKDAMDNKEPPFEDKAELWISND